MDVPGKERWEMAATHSNALLGLHTSQLCDLLLGECKGCSSQSREGKGRSQQWNQEIQRYFSITRTYWSYRPLSPIQQGDSKEGAKVKAMGSRVVVSGFQYNKKGCTYDLVEETIDDVQVRQSVGSRDASCATGI